MITVTGVSKAYRAGPVVQNVTFSCPAGTITGLLGPNGAGKSTVLRLVLGLARPDAGLAMVAGRPYARLPQPSRVVGVVLDPTALHPGRTGRAILATAARMAGVDVCDVPAALRRVGLAESAAGARVATYSLGMRQRLALAQALIGDPRVLVLDEPANGLDPEGIAWLRTLLRGFADRGGTVLLSSHLLRDVEATVDALVVMRQGRVVAQGALRALLPAAGLVVRGQDPVALQAALRQRGLAYVPGPDGGVTVVDAEVAEVGRLLADAGVALLELRPGAAAGLEDLFFDLTRGAAA